MKFNDETENLPPDEAGKIRIGSQLLQGLMMLGAGALMSGAYPPLAWSLLVFVAPALLLWWAIHVSPLRAALGGYLWGWGFCLPSFYFLSEIEQSIPFGIAAILACNPMMVAAFASFSRRNYVYDAATRCKGFMACRAQKNFAFGKSLAWAFSIAALWCMLDTWRMSFFPWNYPAAALWNKPLLLQLAEFTGPFGISFLILLGNAFLVCAAEDGKKLRWGIAVLAVIGGMTLAGLLLQRGNYGSQDDVATLKIGAIQGDITQRRNADEKQAREALATYLALTEALLKKHSSRTVDLILWPETAVPFPFFAANEVSFDYRLGVFRLLTRYKVPILLGTLHYERRPAGVKTPLRLTNAAMLLDRNCNITGLYEKIRRVPFGEYIPLRSILPEKVVRWIDMNRDLAPGSSYAHLSAANTAKLGMSICYESVFPGIARREALEGANVLCVLSNDAWYPTTSEPVQHLANAVMRTIETRLPMFRCGNNGGTLLLNRDGRIVMTLDNSTVRDRKRGAGVFEFSFERKPQPTFYVRYGDWFLIFLGLATGFGVAYSAFREYLFRKQLILQKEAAQ
ncbi:MAG: apolipoprotein N-acyltransferase [Victivallaceae bacterium]|nr:apolipoprotein N-acyltransferase [Victivallaceae bacterium]